MEIVLYLKTICVSIFTKFNFAVRYKHKLKYLKNNLIRVKQNNFFDKHNKSQTILIINYVIWFMNDFVFYFSLNENYKIIY